MEHFVLRGGPNGFLGVVDCRGIVTGPELSLDIVDRRGGSGRGPTQGGGSETQEQREQGPWSDDHGRNPGR
jgi:hypothetical protein